MINDLLSMLTAVLITASTVGCGTDSANPASWQLEDGRSLTALDARGDPVVVVVIDPTDVPSCYNTLAAWRAWSHDSGESIHLVLSRPPTQAERRVLLTHGVHPDAVVSAGDGPGGRATPMELVLWKDRIIFESQRVGGSESPLRARLEGKTLHEFVAENG